MIVRLAVAALVAVAAVVLPVAATFGLTVIAAMLAAAHWPDPCPSS